MSELKVASIFEFEKVLQGLPDCTCCTACHKLINEVEECPFPEPNGLWSDKYKCTPDCNYYHEIWDEKELKEELAKDEDKLLSHDADGN